MKIEDIYNKYEFQLFKRHVIIYEDVDDETKERIKNYLKELIEDLYKLDFVRSVSVNKCFEPEDPTVDDIELLVSFDKEYDLKERISLEIKYEGYLQRQLADIEKFEKMEQSPIPENIDFMKIESIAWGAREKLQKINPSSLGQAARIPGVNHTDVNALMVYIKKNK